MPAANRAADSHEIRPLTGIRGVAASLIVFLHFYPAWVLLLPELSVGSPIAVRGSVGVDLFFILSGFILSYVYGAGERGFDLGGYRRFVWFRLARIYPNHLATLAVLVFLVVAAAARHVGLTGDYPFSGLPWQLTLTHAWPDARGGAWNYPSWSISAEWFAYLCVFPAVWRWLRWHWSAAASSLLGYAALALWLFALYNPAPMARPLWQVSLEFTAGGMFFGAYRSRGPFTRACQQYASGLVLLIALLLWLYPLQDPNAPPLIVLLFPALLLGLTAETSWFARLLSSAPALWLGRVSYALYMSHGIAVKMLKILLPAERYAAASGPVRLAVLGGQLLVILLFAAGLYYGVEIPARNRMRQFATWWSSRRRGQARGSAEISSEPTTR